MLNVITLAQAIINNTEGIITVRVNNIKDDHIKRRPLYHVNAIHFKMC
jgi:hypothetical protein